MQMEKGKKAMLWSGIRWMEEVEKPSRYFLNLCASKAAKSQINVLCSADNNVITDNKVILAHCKTYFENIYETKRTDRDRNSEQMLDFISSLNPPRLTDIDKLSCEQGLL